MKKTIEYQQEINDIQEMADKYVGRLESEIARLTVELQRYKIGEKQYPEGWVEIRLAVGDNGDYYVLDGERIKGKGDMPYKALQRIEIIPKAQR